MSKWLWLVSSFAFWTGAIITRLIGIVSFGWDGRPISWLFWAIGLFVFGVLVGPLARRFAP